MVKIRILLECEVLIEKSVPRVTVWDHCDSRGRFVDQYLTLEGCFLHTYVCQSSNEISFTQKIFHIHVGNYDFLRHFCDVLVTSASDQVKWPPLQPIF